MSVGNRIAGMMTHRELTGRAHAISHPVRSCDQSPSSRADMATGPARSSVSAHLFRNNGFCGAEQPGGGRGGKASDGTRDRTRSS